MLGCRSISTYKVRRKSCRSHFEGILDENVWDQGGDLTGVVSDWCPEDIKEATEYE